MSKKALIVQGALIEPHLVKALAGLGSALEHLVPSKVASATLQNITYYRYDNNQDGGRKWRELKEKEGEMRSGIQRFPPTSLLLLLLPLFLPLFFVPFFISLPFCYLNFRFLCFFTFPSGRHRFSFHPLPLLLFSFSLSLSFSFSSTSSSFSFSLISFLLIFYR